MYKMIESNGTCCKNWKLYAVKKIKENINNAANLGTP